MLSRYPQVLDELGADDKVLLDLRVHPQIHIALPEPQLLVLKAVELLRQGQQGFGEQDDVLGPDAHLAPLGSEYLALNTNNIADVVLLELLVNGFVHLVLPGIELDAAVPILKVAEGHLAHAPLAHEAAGHLDGLALHGVKVVLDLLGSSVPVKAGDGKGVLPLRLKCCQLFPADAGLLGKAQLRLGLVVLFSHLSSP